MERFIVAAALLLLLTPLVAGQSTFEGEVESIQVGENVSINATVVNPLPISDTLRVVFSGEAIEDGVVTPSYPDSEDINCEQFRSQCEIQIGANAEEDIEVLLEGTAMGQETLSATVNSTITQLSSTDSIEIRVQPYFGRATVSAPGIQGLQVLVLALLGAVASLYLSRSRD